jgi:hypothetical protein
MNSLPYWMQVLQALAVPTVLLLGAAIALFQWRTAQQKVVLDLFDRRMETYTALRLVVAKVMGSSSAATLEASFEFLQAIDRAEFLFGPEVVAHLTKIRDAIDEIRIALKERENLVGPELQANVAQERAAREVVTSFYTTFQLLVARYMRMDQKLPPEWLRPVKRIIFGQNRPWTGKTRS